MLAYALIKTLRPVVIGWANYFRYSECTEIFSKQTFLLYQKLREWASRRHPRMSGQQVKEKYWPSNRTYTFDGTKHKDNWVLCGRQKDKEIHLPRMEWVKSRKHVKIAGIKSPYDGDYVYWAQRNAKHSPLAVRVSTLLKRQDGLCSRCGKQFTNFCKMEVDHITPQALGGKDQYNNLQLPHDYCHLSKTAADLKEIAKTKQT